MSFWKGLARGFEDAEKAQEREEARQDKLTAETKAEERWEKTYDLQLRQTSNVEARDEYQMEKDKRDEQRRIEEAHVAAGNIFVPEANDGAGGWMPKGAARRFYSDLAKRTSATPATPTPGAVTAVDDTEEAIPGTTPEETPVDPVAVTVDPGESTDTTIQKVADANPGINMYPGGTSAMNDSLTDEQIMANAKALKAHELFFNKTFGDGKDLTSEQLEFHQLLRENPNLAASYMEDVAKFKAAGISTDGMEKYYTISVTDNAGAQYLAEQGMSSEQGLTAQQILSRSALYATAPAMLIRDETAVPQTLDYQERKAEVFEEEMYYAVAARKEQLETLRDSGEATPEDLRTLAQINEAMVNHSVKETALANRAFYRILGGDTFVEKLADTEQFPYLRDNQFLRRYGYTRAEAGSTGRAQAPVVTPTPDVPSADLKTVTVVKKDEDGNAVLDTNGEPVVETKVVVPADLKTDAGVFDPNKDIDPNDPGLKNNVGKTAVLADGNRYVLAEDSAGNRSWRPVGDMQYSGRGEADSRNPDLLPVGYRKVGADGKIHQVVVKEDGTKVWNVSDDQEAPVSKVGDTFSNSLAGKVAAAVESNDEAALTNLVEVHGVEAVEEAYDSTQTASGYTPSPEPVGREYDTNIFKEAIDGAEGNPEAIDAVLKKWDERYGEGEGKKLYSELYEGAQPAGPLPVEASGYTPSPEPVGPLPEASGYTPSPEPVAPTPQEAAAGKALKAATKGVLTSRLDDKGQIEFNKMSEKELNDALEKGDLSAEEEESALTALMENSSKVLFPAEQKASGFTPSPEPIGNANLEDFNAKVDAAGTDADAILRVMEHYDSIHGRGTGARLLTQYLSNASGYTPSPEPVGPTPTAESPGQVDVEYDTGIFKEAIDEAGGNQETIDFILKKWDERYGKGEGQRLYSKLYG